MKKLAPKDCNTFKKVCSLNRDNYGLPEVWMLTDGNEVTICKQRNGYQAVASITLTREDFNKLIAWYIRPQTLRKKG